MTDIIKKPNLLTLQEEYSLEKDIVNKHNNNSKHRCCKCNNIATWCDCDVSNRTHFYCDKCVTNISNDFLHQINGFNYSNKCYLIRVKKYKIKNSNFIILTDCETILNLKFDETNNRLFEKASQICSGYKSYIEEYGTFLNYLKTQLNEKEFKILKNICKKLRYEFEEEIDIKKLL